MNQKEIWKDIPNYEGIYQVSSFGRVKSLEIKNLNKLGVERTLKEKIRKTPQNKRGYKSVMLRKNGKYTSFPVHKLVAIVFLNHKPCGMKLVVDHIDNDNTNNKVENLQVISNRENVSKGFKLRFKTSMFTGVSWSIKAKKWRAAFGNNGKYYHIGYYKCEFKAYLAYQKELKKITE